MMLFFFLFLIINCSSDDTTGSNPNDPPTPAQNSIPDADKDGVVDADDLCPDTPEGEEADADGCSPSEKDSDGDGVTDDVDKCPDTEFIDEIDEFGCDYGQQDSDNDGVANSSDYCPETPAGDAVNDVGCSENEECKCIGNIYWVTLYKNVETGEIVNHFDLSTEGYGEPLDSCIKQGLYLNYVHLFNIEEFTEMSIAFYDVFCTPYERGDFISTCDDTADYGCDPDRDLANGCTCYAHKYKITGELFTQNISLEFVETVLLQDCVYQRLFSEWEDGVLYVYDVFCSPFEEDDFEPITDEDRYLK